MAILSPGKLSFLLFFLFLLFLPISDAITVRNTYLGLNFMCQDGVAHWNWYIDQTNAPTVGRYTPLSYLKIGVRVRNSTTNYILNSTGFSPNCYGGATGNDICFASGSFSSPMLSCASMSSYITRIYNSTVDQMTAYPNCTALFGDHFTKFVSNRGPDDYFFLLNGTSGAILGLFDKWNDGAGNYYNGGVCVDTYFANLSPSFTGNYFFVANYSPCRECTENQYSCNPAGYPYNGNLYRCVNARWTVEKACLEGGYVNCTPGGTFLECANVRFGVVIANKARQVNRVSITDNLGRELSRKDAGYYRMYSGQSINEIAFRLLDNTTFKDWPITSYDTVSIGLTWNSSEMSCTKTAGYASYSRTKSYYADSSSYNCTLKAGYVASNMTLQINATLSSNGSIFLLTPFLTKNFTIQLISDMALLDNFQLVYINESLLGFSGHIIKLSDLSEVKESLHPFAEFEYGIYSKYNGAFITGGTTGRLNGTDLNFLYGTVTSGGFNINDTFYVNATVGADGFANSTYIREDGKIAETRVKSFKCRNSPANVSVISTTIINPENGTELGENVRTTGVNFICTFELANSSVSIISQIANSSVFKGKDMSAGFETDGSQSVYEAFYGTLYGFFFHDQSWERVHFSRSIGDALYYELNSTFYVNLNEMGYPMDIPPGRYVGQWGLLDNVMFPGVKTYVDITVDAADTSSFLFNEGAVRFHNATYYEGDTAYIIAQWYDPEDQVRDWALDIYSDAGYSYRIPRGSALRSQTSYAFKGPNLTYCDPLGYNETCLVFDSYECVGTERLCTAVFRLPGVQGCTSFLNGTNTCLSYKWQFTPGVKTDIHAKMTLYLAGVDEGVSRIATAHLETASKSVWDASSWPWWIWILVIVLALFVLLTILRRAGR